MPLPARRFPAAAVVVRYLRNLPAIFSRLTAASCATWSTTPWMRPWCDRSTISARHGVQTIAEFRGNRGGPARAAGGGSRTTPGLCRGDADAIDDHLRPVAVGAPTGTSAPEARAARSGESPRAGFSFARGCSYHLPVRKTATAFAPPHEVSNPVRCSARHHAPAPACTGRAGRAAALPPVPPPVSTPSRSPAAHDCSSAAVVPSATAPQAPGHPDWQTPSNGQFRRPRRRSTAPATTGRKSRAELAAVILKGVRRRATSCDVMPRGRGA